jgi:hypothetical protein
MAKPTTAFDLEWHALHSTKMLSWFHPHRKRADVERERLIRSMRHARRVIIDAAAREVVVDAMRHRFAELVANLAFVRLPFERLWLEWPTEDGKARGLLIEPRGNQPGLYRMFSPVAMYKPVGKGDEPPDTRFGDPITAFGAFELLLDFRDELPPEPPRLKPDDISPPDEEWDETLSVMPDWLPRSPAIDTFERRVWPAMRDVFVEQRAHLQDKIGDEEVAQLAWQALKGEVHECWLPVIVLALMSERALVVPAAETKPAGRMLVGGRSVPFLTRSVIEIGLPRQVHATDGESAGQGAPKRRHEVAGHWCFSHRLDPGCTHEWVTLVEGQRYQCRHCGGKRWRRREHVRGNAELGWVLQERHVVRSELQA